MNTQILKSLGIEQAGRRIILKMEAVGSSQTSDSLYRTTHRHGPDLTTLLILLSTTYSYADVNQSLHVDWLFLFVMWATQGLEHSN
jgi:hypothetical protein